MMSIGGWRWRGRARRRGWERRGTRAWVGGGGGEEELHVCLRDGFAWSIMWATCSCSLAKRALLSALLDGRGGAS
jgi:hypothetical protein